MFKVGLPLTLALAIVSGTVFAQEEDQTSEARAAIAAAKSANASTRTAQVTSN
jgi:hypothetical protein